jgi:hypothetical protein
VKDLPDMALLALSGTVEAAWMRAALDGTFEFRGTHRLPEKLPSPPIWWERPYKAMATDNELPWATLDAVYEAARMFLDPVLEGVQGLWEPSHWRWS